METKSLVCPRCGESIEAGQENPGAAVQCPFCHAVVPAPTIAGAPSAADVEAVFSAPSATLFANLPTGPATEMPAIVPEEPAPASSAGLEDELLGGASEPAEWPTISHPSDQAADSSLETPIPMRRPPRRSNVGALVLIFLIPYAVIATGFIAWLLTHQAGALNFDPLERLPDPKPGNGGAKRIHPQSPLPSKLKTSLHHTLQIGDLAVTPLRVEKDEDGRLSLSLKLRNTSEDVAFKPLLPRDCYRFERAAAVDSGPYTYLEAGDKRLYVLGAEWEKPPRRPSDAPFDGTLQPAEEMIAVVRTRSEDKGLLQAAEAARGSFLWRVQLRRGLIDVHGAEVSATAVIGVEFSARAIGQGEDALARNR